MPNSISVTRRGLLGFLTALTASPSLLARTVTTRTAWNRVAPRGWTTSAAGSPRFQHAAVALPGGQVVVIGGYLTSPTTRSRSAGGPTSSVQMYDPRSDVWFDLAPMNIPRARHAAVLLPDGNIAVLGGIATNPLSSVEVYLPASDEWVVAEAMPAPIMDHAASVAGNNLVITGGQNGSPVLTLPVPSGS